MNKEQQPYEAEQTASTAANSPATPAPDDLLAALRAERTHGFWTLRFDNQLEPAFRDHLARSARGTRLTMFISVLIILLVTPWFSVYFLGEPSVISLRILLLNYVQLPTIVVGVILAWYRPLSLYIDRLCILGALSAVTCLLLQRDIAASYEFDIPLEYIGFVIVALVFVTRVRFWHTVPWVVIATAAMTLNEWLYVAPPLDGYYRVLASCSLIALVCMGGYSNEYFMRQSWLSNRLLKHLSDYDSMTNLLNRRSLHKEIQRLIAHSQRERCAFAIALLDIDYFKNYNDVYGHDRGDKVIQRIAVLLRDCARRPQDFCGRYGGEEFIMAWADGQYQELFALADSLCRRVEQAAIPHIASPISDYVTVSIGFYWIKPGPEAGTPGPVSKTSANNISWLIEAADEQLYKAKFSGRNRVVGKQAETCAHKQAAVALQP